LEGSIETSPIRVYLERLTKAIIWAADDPNGTAYAQNWLQSLESILSHSELDSFSLMRMMALLRKFHCASPLARRVSQAFLANSDFLTVWYTYCVEGRMMTQWSPRQLTGVIYSMMHLALYPKREFLEIWYSTATHKINEFRDQELVNSLYALAKMKVSMDSSFLMAWFGRCREAVVSFSTQALSMSIYSLGRLGASIPSDFLVVWTASARPKLSLFRSRELVSTLYGFHLLSLRPAEEFLMDWISAASISLPRFSCQELVNALYAIGKLEIPVDLFFIQLWCLKATEKMADFTSADFACTMKAFALLNVRPPPNFLLRWYAGAQLILLRDEVKPPELVCMVHAIAELGVPHNQTFLLFWCQTASRHVHRFSTEELTLSVYSFAAMDVEPIPVFWTEWLRKAMELLHNFNNMELATVGYAVGKLDKTEADSFMVRFDEVSASRLVSFSARELSTILYGFSKTPFNPSQRWFHCWLTAAEPLRDEFSPQAVSNILFALVSLDTDDAYVSQWFQIVEQNWTNFSSLDLGCIYRSCVLCRRNLIRSEFLSNLVEASEGKLKDMQLRTLVTVAYSLAKLRYKPHDSFRVRWEQSALSSVIEFSDLNLVQAIWAYAAWQERMGKELHILIWGIITERLDRLGIVCMLTLLRALTIYRHFGLSHRFESAIGEAGECLFFRLKRNRSRWRLRGVLTGFHRARNSQDAQDDPYH